MKNHSIIIAAFLSGLIFVGCKEFNKKVEFQPTALPVPTDKKFTPRLAKKIDKAIKRGVEFLIKTQNKNGSWGTAGNVKGLNILTPVPSGHDNYQFSCTALCIQALIDADSKLPGARKALKRAEDWMLKNAAEIKRSSREVLYNTWAHAYAIEAFVKMYKRLDKKDPQRKRIFQEVANQVRFLDMYQTSYGGWAYYYSLQGLGRPYSSPTSFTTATCLVALKRAQSIGVKIPKRMVRRALAVIIKLRNPNFTYAYDTRFMLARGGSASKINASLGRAQVCNLAARLWGDKRVSDKVLETWADRLIRRNSWVSRGRKTPKPHENWFNIAGYYYYYGHYYAFECMEEMPEKVRRKYQVRLARILLSHQERDDGSWWDFPVFNYGKYFGTPFAIMCLSKCRTDQAFQAK